MSERPGFNPNQMINFSPKPEGLMRVVERIEYRAGWTFEVKEIDRGQDSYGLTLIIRSLTADSYAPEMARKTKHYFIVPAASYNERTWRRWVFDCVLLVEQHEACEFFKVDGQRPYAPHHGNGENPYVIFERGTDEEARKWPGQ